VIFKVSRIAYALTSFISNYSFNCIVGGGGRSPHFLCLLGFFSIPICFIEYNDGYILSYMVLDGTV